MLKKFDETGGNGGAFSVGTPVYIVMRDGSILEGHTIEDRLMDLVSLNRSPLDGSEKQGFTVKGNLLKPNWCEGRKRIIAACATREEANTLAEKRRKGEE